MITEVIRAGARSSWVAWCLGLCLFAAAATAQTYPNKPVRLVVPFPPGGVADLIARPLAEKLSGTLGQPVVVDNRGGATGTIGAAAVATAPADGYTLLLGTTNEIAMSPTLYKSLPYDPTKAFAAVAVVAEFPNVLVVGPSVKANTLKELIALAKATPGKLTFASSGAGSTNHLTAELFKSIAGVEVIHVPYKGGGPSVERLARRTRRCNVCDAAVGDCTYQGRQTEGARGDGRASFTRLAGRADGHRGRSAWSGRHHVERNTRARGHTPRSSRTLTARRYSGGEFARDQGALRVGRSRIDDTHIGAVCQHDSKGLRALGAGHQAGRHYCRVMQGTMR